MQLHKLLKSQANQIFSLIQEAGCSPSDFRIRNRGATLSTLEYPCEANAIQYRETRYAFVWEQKLIDGAKQWRAVYQIGRAHV